MFFCWVVAAACESIRNFGNKLASLVKLTLHLDQPAGIMGKRVGLHAYQHDKKNQEQKDLLDLGQCIALATSPTLSPSRRFPPRGTGCISKGPACRFSADASSPRLLRLRWAEDAPSGRKPKPKPTKARVLDLTRFEIHNHDSNDHRRAVPLH